MRTEKIYCRFLTFPCEKPEPNPFAHTPVRSLGFARGLQYRRGTFLNENVGKGNQLFVCEKVTYNLDAYNSTKLCR